MRKILITLENILRKEPNIIIHLAAVSHATRSNQNPLQTFDNSLLLLKFTRKFKK